MKSSAADAPLVDRILDAAEEVLRRHGPEKTNVVDIARSLGMSHGNIYRHFPSKKALIEAVAVRWLNVVNVPLQAIAADQSRPAGERLKLWFDHLRASKLKKVRGDPELFRVHYQYFQALREVTDDHVTNLHKQVERIIADGMASKEFSPKLNPVAAARAFLQATSRFHHPALIMLDPPPKDADARAVFALILAGLQVGAV